MSSSSEANLVALLNNISNGLNRYFAIFIFVFGIVGNILNIIVLWQRPLSSNPCAWLFLVSSIAYLMSILTCLTPRFLFTWNADISSTNQILCKLRVFTFFNSATIASWLITLATVDRWLSSSKNVNRRQRSTLKNAQRGSVIIVILSTLIETQQLYCFEANLINTPLKCYTNTVICGIVSDTFFALVTVLFPLILMIVFGLMVISNVRQVQSRLQPMTVTIDGCGTATATVGGESQNQRKKTDRQLLIMLLFQILLILFLTLPLALSKLYTTITRNRIKSALETTIENLTFNLFLLFFNIASGMPFYIYTLTGGSVFRKALFGLIERLGQRMMCRLG